jgi:hypothetical protein
LMLCFSCSFSHCCRVHCCRFHWVLVFKSKFCFCTAIVFVALNVTSVCQVCFTVPAALGTCLLPCPAWLSRPFVLTYYSV